MKTRPSHKILIVNICFFISSLNSLAQKTQININAYSGIFSYRGNGVTATSSIITGYPFGVPSVPYPFTKNVYGTGKEFSYSIEIQAIKKGKNNFLYGTGLAFEMLASKIRINTVYYIGDYSEPVYPAAGSTRLTNSTINVNPFVGKRFSRPKYSMDVLTGIDIGIGLVSREKGSSKRLSDGHEFTTNNKLANPGIDFRPRIQFKAQFNKTGLLLGYSLGITNINRGSNSTVHSGFFRTGISYTLK